MRKTLSFMSWNGFPNYVSKTLLRLLKSNSTIPSSNNSIERNDTPENIFRLPYAGKVGEQLLKRCLKEVKRCLNVNVKFRVLYDTKKKSFYCNIKDKVPHNQRNRVIYKIKCPGCNGCYISKTEKCLITRITEQGTKETEPMFKHLSECELFKDSCWLYYLLSLVNEDDDEDISLTSHIFNAVLQNHEILNSNRDWSQLTSLQMYYNKDHEPIINHCLKASKELSLFN